MKQNDDEVECSIEKKLRQAKRNSILNSSRSQVHIQLNRQDTEVKNRRKSSQAEEIPKADQTTNQKEIVNNNEIDFQGETIKNQEALKKGKTSIKIKIKDKPEKHKNSVQLNRDQSMKDVMISRLEQDSSLNPNKNLNQSQQEGSAPRQDSSKQLIPQNKKLSFNSRKDSENTATLKSPQNIQIEPLFLSQIPNPTDINSLVQGLISETQEQLQKQQITESILNRQQSIAKERQQHRNSIPLILQMRQQTLKKKSALNTESDKSSSPSNKFQAQLSLQARRSQLANLKPIETMNDQQINLNIIRKGNSPSGNGNLLKVQDNSNSNTPSPYSVGSQSPTTKRKLILQDPGLKRKEIIQKFQHSVKKAVELKKQNEFGSNTFTSLTQRDEEQKIKNLDTFNSNYLSTDLQFSTNQYFLSRPDQNSKNNLPIPMTPMLKRNKMSFFEVFKNLNPFKKAEVKVTDLNSELESQQQDPQITREERKKRAKYLWWKAKSVLRAINIWKQIQTDIQLYGTHNYEFRTNFKITQNQNLLTKTTSMRREILEGVSGNKRFLPFIHPESKFTKFWTIIIIFFLMYAGTLMPFRLSFLEYEYGDAWFYLDLIADLTFFVDVFVNSFTAFYDEDAVLIMDNRRIFVRYFKSWFAWDLIASFPITLLEAKDSKLSWQVVSNFNQLIRLFRLPRLYVLVRFTKLSKVIGNFKKNKFFFKVTEFVQLNVGVWKLITFALAGCICIHCSACFWYLSSRISDFEPNTWVVRNQISDDSDGRKYLMSIYWSVSTVLTVGYGDIHAETNPERLISVVWMMIGVIFYSVTIGLITVILGKIDSRSSQLKSKLEIIDMFCQEAKVSIELKRKIKEALEYHSNRNAFSYIENNSILSEIPTQLKSEIAMQIHSGKIGRLPFFQNKDQSFIGNIVPQLQPLRILANDYIYMQDDHPYDIYFIVDGRVNLTMEISECVFKSWPQGAYFGEIEIIFQKKRICTAKAEQDCDLFTLNKKYYQTTIYNDYPEIDKQLRELALEREAKINQTLEKARRVLESIGIRDALLLPTRQRRNSINSQHVAKKRREAFKNSSMKKVAKSFDEAHRSFSMSEHSMQKSSKGQTNNSILNNVDRSNSPNKNDIQDDASSSSGDFNIWGDNQKSESDKDSIKTDQSMKENKQQPAVSGNYDRFKEIFDQQKKRQMDLKKINTIKSEVEITSSESDSDSSNSSKSEASIVHKKSPQEKAKKAKVEKPQQQKSDDSLETSKSLQSGFDGITPKINIIEIKDNQNQEEEHNQTSKAKENYLSPLQDKNSNGGGLYNSQFSNFLSNDDIIKNLVKQHSSSNNTNDKQLSLRKQNTEEQKFQLKVERALQKNESPPSASKRRKLKKDSVSSSENMTLDKNKKSTYSLSSSTINYQEQNHKNKQQDMRSYTKLQELGLSPISYLPTLPSSQDLELSFQTFKIEIKNPNAMNIKKQQIKKSLKDVNQQRQLKEMSHQVKRIKGHFQENSLQYENMEFKVQTLQSSMDLMAKMLKDIGQKQMQKQFQTHREEIKRNQSDPSAGSNSSQANPQSIPPNKNPKNNPQNQNLRRDKGPRYDQYRTKMQQYNDSNAQNFQNNYFTNNRNNANELGMEFGSLGSSDWLKHSFTLDSNDSLIPIKRIDRDEKKLMSTTVEDRKKEQQMAFSYSDDLEILQRDYGDPDANNQNNRQTSKSNQSSILNHSLPDQ